jgi:hypothetical protein
VVTWPRGRAGAAFGRGPWGLGRVAWDVGFTLVGRFAGGLVGIALNNLPGGLRLLSGVFLPATGMTAGYIS